MSKVTKIKFIKSLAVFGNFQWDNSVKDKDGHILSFKDINILYGRNYSGKTTLSGIFRAFETGKISDKYDNPEFQIEFSDNTIINQTQIDQPQEFRVFNTDFIDENLSVLRNPDGKIQPFAILGSENNTLTQEIEHIQNELGKKSDEEKTGLYKELADKKQALDNAKKQHNKISKELEDSLIEKAKTMKNNDRTFVDANYNKNSLKTDIEKVIKDSLSVISDEEVVRLKKVLNEEEKIGLKELSISLKYKDLVENAKYLITRKIESAEKIKELVENALLNKWVEQGINLHQDRKTCAFCGQLIPEQRMDKLQHHFNEEMDILQKQLENLIVQIRQEQKDCIDIGKGLKETDFYVKFQDGAKAVIATINSCISDYCKELGTLISQLEKKKNDVFHINDFTDITDHTQAILDAQDEYNKIVKEAISYGTNLATEKTHAKNTLRLNIVKQFIDTIRYDNKVDEINKTKAIETAKQAEYDEFHTQITRKELELKRKKTQLNDEAKGAEKVNEYLSDFFGHDSLKLVPIQENEEIQSDKHYRFEIQRNGKQAFNLSEGECRLVAFAYFMAKLHDVETAGIKPIIWIDDPICSLDANHVFFVYSLIYAEIAIKDNYEQLFIATHNLDFLKYLLRLRGNFIGQDTRSKVYFMLERKGDISNLVLMPDYMKKHVTEFNYLFDTIYQCATVELNDNTYPLFYNFSNNARKFLEIFLFYLFPDSSDDRQKQENFFGKKLPVFLTERVTNEYSHLAGGVERASSPIEYPIETMKKDAQLILDCIKQHNEPQYKALLNSIGVKTKV